MTSINSINSFASIPTGKQPTKELGKDAFLKILVTQLQNQDATSPMKDGEFIAQMSQLSVSEQLSNLNKSLTTYLHKMNDNQLSQYSNMIDKKVTWLNTASNQQESGYVTGILYRDNLIYYKVGDQEVLSNEIIGIEKDK